MKRNNLSVKTYEMATIALMTALMCILGPIAIPIGLVPISLTNLVIYFTIYLLGAKKGTLSYIIYLLLGIFGLPVFSGYSSGLSKLGGPTGGYLIGFIFMALLTGIFLKLAKYSFIPSCLGMILATAVAYLFGTVWFVYQLKCTVAYALGVCVFPFLFGDFAKIVITATFGMVIRMQLIKAGLLSI